MGKTAKVHSTGRFGSRYGVGIRKRVLKVELKQKDRKKCPECGLAKLKRKAAGIYFCVKCKKEFAGGAYVPETMTGSLIKKMVSQKQFSSELIELPEEPEEKQEQKTEEKKTSKKEKLITKAKSVFGIKEKEKHSNDNKEEIE